MFRDSLAGKFALMFLALLIPLGVVGLTISRGLSTNAEELLQARHVKELAVRSFSLVLTQDDVTKEILLDPTRITEAGRKIDAYDQNRELLREIVAVSRDPSMSRIADALERFDDEQLRPLDGKILEASVEQGRRAAQQIYFSQYEPLRREYLALGRELTDRAEQVAVQAEVALAAKNRRSVLNVVLSLFSGMALVAGVIWLITRDIQRRLQNLMDTLERVARRDLRETNPVQSTDEIGRIELALSGAIVEMRSALLRVSDTSNEVEIQVASISQASSLVAKVASKQGVEVSRASDAMEKATANVWEIAESARTLKEMVNASHSTIDSIASMSNAFHQRSDLLNERIEQTVDSVGDMSATMDQVTSSIEVLSDAARETSVSATQMATSMNAVDQAATTSEELWKQMVTRGESGISKMRETITGIEEVQKTTATAEEVVKGLGDRAVEIGTILDVIKSVADETSLLALNAAIIAAQSGENGRAFAVVAEEIGSLAVRVTTHTQQIEKLISSVQNESGNAIEAIVKGSESVSKVVKLSSEAGEVVEEMMRSSQESANQLGEIAQDVRGQNLAAKRVVELMTRTDGAVNEIRAAVERQNQGNIGVLESTSIMQEAATEMKAGTLEQAASMGEIAQSIEEIGVASSAVEKALDEHTRSTLSVAEFLEKVGARSVENTRSAELTSKATIQLRQFVESLRREVVRFTL